MMKYSEEDLMNQPWVSQDGKGNIVILPQKLYAYLKKEANMKVTDKCNVYIFNGKYYQPLSTQDLKAIIKAHVPLLLRNRKHWEAVYEEFKTDFADVKEVDFDTQEDIVAFENGVLNLRTGKLEEHNPKYNITRVVHANFKKELTLADAPLFQKFLNDLVGNTDSTQDFLLSYIGAILSNVWGKRWKSVLMLVGKGNTGKSVLRELTIMLVGEENNIAIELRRMQEKFGAAPLFRKRLAGSGDLEYIELSDLNILKSLTGGDMVSGEFKGKDLFSFQYKGMLWFNANELPYFRGDRGEHVYDRFVIVRCNNVIPVEQRDPMLLDKLWGERDAIASVAIKLVMEAVVKNNYKLPETNAMKEERKRYAIKNNSLFTFVSECCYLHEGEVRTSQFHQVYKRWCDGNRVRPERLRDIPIQLEEQFGIVINKHNGIRYYSLYLNEELLDEFIEEGERPNRKSNSNSKSWMY